MYTGHFLVQKFSYCNVKEHCYLTSIYENFIQQLTSDKFFFLDRVCKGLPYGVVKEFFRTSKNFSCTVKKNYRQNVRLSSSDFFSLESQVILPLFSIKFPHVISWLLYNSNLLSSPFSIAQLHSANLSTDSFRQFFDKVNLHEE